jgi:hypothetical protein
MIKHGVVAGPGERTFEERYEVTLNLPMSERDFLALLNRLNLEYQDAGSEVIPHPIWARDALDLSKLSRTYLIDGPINNAGKFRETYRAWIDKDGRVIYMENAFGYFGAP